MRCSWDPDKSAANLAKRGLGFEEAARLFELPEHLILEEYDFGHSDDEDRIRSIGPIDRGIVVVISTELGDEDTIRIISARVATSAERRRFADMIAGEP